MAADSARNREPVAADSARSRGPVAVDSARSRGPVAVDSARNRGQSIVDHVCKDRKRPVVAKKPIAVQQLKMGDAIDVYKRQV